ncbi:putative DNA binding protein [Pyrobaculum oguniense TE7]|uniref:DNA binding protein n=1 Tax=Pyrobaculum oguniense (strain DSM 13380 / JCM 10595 / TE7) TaxID=698757 RepID=H6Q907_PYROT|nr:putative DNA binding protein [Pyrobaculum oguniense TE7]
MLKVKIVALHEGCWTSDLDTQGTTLAMSFFPKKNYFRSIVAFNEGPNLQQVKGIVRILSSRRIGTTHVVDFLNKYDDSMAGALNDLGVLIIKNKLYGGLEEWEILTYKWAIREVKSSISSIAKIKKISVDNFKPPPPLTQAESAVLRALVQLGYFDHPRRVTLESVGRHLGMSKSTVVYHLRNALKKISITYFEFF